MHLWQFAILVSAIGFALFAVMAKQLEQLTEIATDIKGMRAEAQLAEARLAVRLMGTFITKPSNSPEAPIEGLFGDFQAQEQNPEDDDN